MVKKSMCVILFVPLHMALIFFLLERFSMAITPPSATFLIGQTLMWISLFPVAYPVLYATGDLGAPFCVALELWTGKMQYPPVNACRECLFLRRPQRDGFHNRLWL